MKIWFMSGKDLDAELTEKFGGTIQAFATEDKYKDWLDHPRSGEAKA